MRTPSHPEQADHEILAFRTMGLKTGKSGLSEDDFVVRMGGEDDGEKNGGNTLRKCLEEEGAVDVVVVVSRYYGGIMLGPARFDHMRTVTKDACKLLSDSLALTDLLSRLNSLDHEISDLTLPHTAAASVTSPPKPPPKYADDKTMTVEKAERLVKAREKRIEFLKKAKEKSEGGGEGSANVGDGPSGSNVAE